MDMNLVEKLYKFKERKIERPLVTKEFYPELEKEDDDNKGK